MSRPIKFRVWDTENAKMLPWEEIWYSVLNVPEAMVGGGVPWIAFLTMAMIAPDTKYVAEQWTGLLDSKGVEIYEGDIVDAWSQGQNAKCHVKWGQGIAGFFLYHPRGTVWSLSGGDPEYSQETVTILGNIHQHPELLKT